MAMPPQDMPSSPQPRPQRVVVDAVVLFPADGWLGALSDRLSHRRDIHGTSLRCLEGVIENHLLVLATPKTGAPISIENAFQTLFTIYQPHWLIIAGPGRANAQPGEVVVYDPSSSDLSDSADAYSSQFVQAAAAYGARLAMVIAFREPEEEVSPGMLNIEQQSTFAGKAGATLAALWRKPTSAAELVQRKLVQIDQQNQIADHVIKLVQRET